MIVLEFQCLSDLDLGGNLKGKSAMNCLVSRVCAHLCPQSSFVHISCGIRVQDFEAFKLKLSMCLCKGVGANCFCASLLRTQIFAAICAVTNDSKWSLLSALLGFNDLGRSTYPILLLMDHFLYRYSTLSEKKKKIYRLDF